MKNMLTLTNNRTLISKRFYNKNSNLLTYVSKSYIGKICLRLQITVPLDAYAFAVQNMPKAKRLPLEGYGRVTVA